MSSNTYGIDLLQRAVDMYGIGGVAQILDISKDNIYQWRSRDTVPRKWNDSLEFLLTDHLKETVEKEEPVQDPVIEKLTATYVFYEPHPTGGESTVRIKGYDIVAHQLSTYHYGHKVTDPVESIIQDFCANHSAIEEKV